MPQMTCAPASVPEPVGLSLGVDPSKSLVQLIANVTLLWQDGSADTWLANTGGATLPILSAYDGANLIDTVSFEWLIVATKGTSGPRLVKAQDYGIMDAVLGGTPTWAALWRIVGGVIYPFQQVAGIGGLPMPLVDGALLYVDPTTHQARWLSPTIGDVVRGVLNPAGGVPIWQPYGIGQGSQGSVLTDDRANSGLPIWESLSDLATQIGPFLPGGGGGATWCRTWDFTLNAYSADWGIENGPKGVYAPGVGYASTLSGTTDILMIASARGSMSSVTDVEIFGSATYSAAGETERAINDNFSSLGTSAPIGHFTTGTGAIDDNVHLSGGADHLSIVFYSEDTPRNGQNIIRALRVRGIGVCNFAGGTPC
jgi:hypothetical protein